MMNIRNNRHGAVTIMVSMMLIPALLISGTAVDLARIHTAKAMAENTNQLIANAALSQYDGLLKDLYGLFGVASNDPALGTLVDEYVQMSIFGEVPNDRWIQTGIGTFNTFNGSSANASITSIPGTNLRNKQVLRRQIEEYMKFRGPVVLVQRLLGELDQAGPELEVSNNAINQQKRVNQVLGELCQLYREYYDLIVTANGVDKPGSPVYEAVAAINWTLLEIKASFEGLRYAHERLKIIQNELNFLPHGTTASPKENDEYSMLQKEELELQKFYKAERARIGVLAEGGSWQGWRLGGRKQVFTAVGSSQEPAKYPDDSLKYEWVDGAPISDNYPGLAALIKNVHNAADAFKSVFDTLIITGKNVDSKTRDTLDEIANLETILNDPDCNDKMAAQLSATAQKCKANIDKFKNFESCAVNFKPQGIEYLDKVKSDYDEVIVKYRDKNNPGRGSLTISELSAVPNNSDYVLDLEAAPDSTKAAYYAAFEDVTYSMRGGFKRFGDISGNQALWVELEKMARDSAGFSAIPVAGFGDTSGSDDPEEKQKSVLGQVGNVGKDSEAALASKPKGATSVPDDTISNGGWGSPSADRLIKLIAAPFKGLSDIKAWALLMSYSTGMFSHYTTDKPQLTPASAMPPKPVSVANIPITPKVNYFYQSEWEYLLVGNKDAVHNLNSVRTAIFVIREVVNLIAAFAVEDIQLLATSIFSATVVIPFVGPALAPVLWFLTFVAFATAESTYDVIRLRSGHKIPLLKTPDQFKCKPSTIVSVIRDAITMVGVPEPASEHDEESGFSYEHYLFMFFFITSREDTLLDRMANLIEWNIVNYHSKANINNMSGDYVNNSGAADAMKEAFEDENCFRMERRLTDFAVKTDIDLRLMFLTLPFFQGEFRRQGRPLFSNMFPVTAVDYRGY